MFSLVLFKQNLLTSHLVSHLILISLTLFKQNIFSFHLVLHLILLSCTKNLKLCFIIYILTVSKQFTFIQIMACYTSREGLNLHRKLFVYMIRTHFITLLYHYYYFYYEKCIFLIFYLCNTIWLR